MDFDGAYCREGNGAGVILISPSRKIFRYSFLLNFECTNNIAGLNVRKVWVEGDSLNIINCLNKITKPSWTISNIISQAINIINSFEICIILHNFREANRAVDWAANVACMSEQKIIWNNYDLLPVQGRLLMDYDKMGSRKRCYINDDHVRNWHLCSNFFWKVASFDF